ncbi:MAG: DUF58 domain-containing protein [Actinomycetota bacterium]|nr:DUF58 domain-containing protein [Actinomycetota bacterium]
MPTGRGWAALGAGAASLAMWGAFGEGELLLLGVFLILGVALALAVVLAGRSTVVLARRVSPNVVHEGQQAVVEVSLANQGQSLRDLAVQDEVAGLGSARFVAARLPRAEPVTARYEVACRSRGVYRVGPVSVTVSDPLGLAETGGRLGAADRLVVYPAVEDLEGLPSVRGRDPSHQAVRPHFSHRGGEDFFTLREYQMGDDLRLVHWRSSAKQDELMIRQLEVPWQARALVFLDARASAYRSPAAFEKAVQGAASVVRHLHRLGFAIDLWAGSTGATQEDGDRYRSAMEVLATVQPVDALDLRGSAARLRRESGGGAMVMVTGMPDAEDVGAFLLLSRDFGSLLVMAVAEVEGASLVEFQRAGAVTVAVPPQGAWAPAWRQAVRLTWSTASAG